MERMKAAHALSKEKNEKLRVNLDYNIVSMHQLYMYMVDCFIFYTW